MSMCIVCNEQARYGLRPDTTLPGPLCGAHISAYYEEIEIDALDNNGKGKRAIRERWAAMGRAQ